MNKLRLTIVAIVFCIGVVGARINGVPIEKRMQSSQAAQSMALDSLDGLEIKAVSESGAEPVKVKADIALYNGRRALHMLNDDSTLASSGPSGGESLAIVKVSDFKDGAIEVDLIGMPRLGSNSESRGFVGLAFRIQGDVEKFENFYLRFTNGRSDDQLRRNHSTQYSSFPDFPWSRLRQETPGVYESYVDIQEKAWTMVKVVVSGSKAKLYVNGADQPCLVVNDLKLGTSHGRVALWAGSDTEAYFSNLRMLGRGPEETSHSFVRIYNQAPSDAFGWATPRQLFLQ